MTPPPAHPDVPAPGPRELGAVAEVLAAFGALPEGGTRRVDGPGAAATVRRLVDAGLLAPVPTSPHQLTLTGRGRLVLSMTPTVPGRVRRAETLGRRLREALDTGARRLAAELAGAALALAAEAAAGDGGDGGAWTAPDGRCLRREERLCEAGWSVLILTDDATGEVLDVRTRGLPATLRHPDLQFRADLEPDVAVAMIWTLVGRLRAGERLVPGAVLEGVAGGGLRLLVASAWSGDDEPPGGDSEVELRRLVLPDPEGRLRPGEGMTAPHVDQWVGASTGR